MVKKIVLKNGLRVVFVPQPSSVASTILILVEAGSEYETKKINGISHFLEHLVFKGTTNRPEPGAISTELDSLGAQSNAFTGQEYTGYWAKVENSKLPKALEIVSDLYLNPIFNPEEIEKERGVVIEEMNMYEDMPMRQVHEEFSSLLYGDQPAGWSITGKKETIRTLQKNQFIEYRSRYYVAPSTVVVIAGDFHEKKILGDVKKYFGTLKRKGKVRKVKTKEHQKKSRVLVRYKDSDQAHFVLGVRTFSLFDKRRYALSLLADVLGGGMSSRLFKRLREDLGLAYYVRAHSDLSLDHGSFAISAGVDPKRIATALEAVIAELKRIAKEPVGPNELQKAKEHLVGSMMLGLETSDELASFYGETELLTRSLVAPEVIARRCRAVTAKEIQALARSILRENGLNLALIGPYKHEGPFKKLLVL